MGGLQDVLARIPGYGGFAAQSQINDQTGQQELQQAVTMAGLAKQLQASQREQQYRGELENLGPEASQEDLARVAAKYGGPDAVLKVHQASIDRKAAEAQRVAQFAQTQEMRLAELERKKEEFAARQAS